MLQRSTQRLRLQGSANVPALTSRRLAGIERADLGSSRLKNILIANRGEIALRVGRTASKHAIRTTVVYTDPDARSQHALSSPLAFNLGAPSAYLDGEKIIAVAKENGCDAVHPGYGFLSENPAFAKGCVDAGLTFIGPPWEAMEAMGNKSRSKDIMTAAGVPCVPGYHGADQDPARLRSEAEKIGFPVLLKAVRGGGGKGMRIVHSGDEFLEQLDSAKSESRSSFGDDAMLVEKYITTPRHIEVQIFADKHGNCVALGERDCSVQRRHQKILEESPAPDLEEEIRQDLWVKARAAALAVGYQGAGTVEFIFDNESHNHYFMEMNTRLQVEHPVTEMVTGEDLVHWQFVIAQGGRLPLSQEEVHARIRERGWAIEARIYAENADMNFAPDSGVLAHVRLPDIGEDVRVDAGFVAGDMVSSHYDPMIAKLIVRAQDRKSCIRKLHAALEAYEIAGPTTNIDFLKKICMHPSFVNGDVETGFIPKYSAELFQPAHCPAEVFAQAALFSLLRVASQTAFSDPLRGTGFTSLSFSCQEFRFRKAPATVGKEDEETVVCLNQSSTETFNIQVNNVTFPGVRSSWDHSSATLTSFFAQRRLDARCVFQENNITVFQQGDQYRLQVPTPKWLGKALGIKDVAHSVLAPMPCKILRLDVEQGQVVQKDQPLLVIESMKMETVIRSPQTGSIAKIVHKQGDICKAGTALIEFEE